MKSSTCRTIKAIESEPQVTADDAARIIDVLTQARDNMVQAQIHIAMRDERISVLEHACKDLHETIYMQALTIKCMKQAVQQRTLMNRLRRLFGTALHRLYEGL